MTAYMVDKSKNWIDFWILFLRCLLLLPDLVGGRSFQDEFSNISSWPTIPNWTKTHRGCDIYWMLRPRLIETEIFLKCQDQDWKLFWILRMRLIETEKFLGCWDRDFLDVKTSRDWTKDVDTKTPWRVLLISGTTSKGSSQS